MNIYFILKYIENLIDNILDNFFSRFFCDKEEKFFFDILKKIKEFVDIFVFSLSLKEMIFSINLFFMSNKLYFSLLLKIYSYVWLIFFILWDLSYGIYFYLFGHLRLSNKLYNDYIFHKPRKEMLIIFNFFLLFLLLLFLIFLFI